MLIGVGKYFCKPQHARCCNRALSSDDFLNPSERPLFGCALPVPWDLLGIGKGNKWSIKTLMYA
jgi:hypothetical protein